MKSKKILVIGSSNTDMTIVTDSLPVPGETVLGGRFTMGAGGKGANQAVAAKRLGGDVTLVCKVGRDIFGDNSLANYSREGLDTSAILRSDRESGVALITVDKSGENCIAVASGANGDFSVGDVDSVREKIVSSDILLLQLEIPVESVVRAAEIAYEAGRYVVLNPAPACTLPEEIFKYVSLLVPNETEASRLSGIDVVDCESARTAASVLHDKGVGNVIITLGAKGCLVCCGGETCCIPALKVDAVDTTAAGDTFCAALCVALSEGRTLADAAVFATSASALTVQKTGAQESLPYRDEMLLHGKGRS